MPTKALKTYRARTAEEWRQWLAEHHESEAEVWLIFYKRHTGEPSVTYEDAVNEALCYGWVDSLIKRLDDRRYLQKFTPRKPDSKWSDTNRKRYEALRAAGRLMPAGIVRAPTDRRPDGRPPDPSALPAYIAGALKKHPAARRTFDSLAPSKRKVYVLWIDSAKRDETKERRLAEALRLLEAGKELGLK